MFTTFLSLKSCLQNIHKLKEFVPVMNSELSLQSTIFYLCFESDSLCTSNVEKFGSEINFNLIRIFVGVASMSLLSSAIPNPRQFE